MTGVNLRVHFPLLKAEKEKLLEEKKAAQEAYRRCKDYQKEPAVFTAGFCMCVMIINSIVSFIILI